MINYTNPDRERFINIAAMALFNVPANEEVTVVDIIDKLRSHYQIIVAADYYPNICCYYPYIRTTQYVPKRISNKALVNHLAEMKPNKCIKCTANSINVRIKDRFDNYHLTKIDCDFPALVESLNF